MTKEDLYTVITQRRSVYPKDFVVGAKIDDKVIEELLELGTWAPTHKLTQPWYFKVFRNEGVKQFFEKQAEIYQAITPKEKITQRKIDKYPLKAQQVSHVVVVIAKHHPENKIPEIEEIVAAACALQNIYLSLNSYGVAGYLSTGDVCYSQQMTEYLELEVGDKCLGFFQLGIPSDELPTVNRRRVAIQEKMEWIG